MVKTCQADRDAHRPYLDDLAEPYDRFIQVMNLPDNHGRIRLLTELSGDGRALDLGCGNGRTCRMIADRYQEFIGVDVSSRILEIVRAKDNPPNGSYECHDVLDLSSERDRTFDTVCTANSTCLMNAQIAENMISNLSGAV